MFKNTVIIILLALLCFLCFCLYSKLDSAVNEMQLAGKMRLTVAEQHAVIARWK